MTEFGVCPVAYGGAAVREQPIPYTVIPGNRKTIAIQIKPEGTVIVRCPRGMPSQQVHSFVMSKAHWIRTHLAAQEKSPTMPPLTQEQLHQLSCQAKIRIAQRVAYFAPLLGVDYGRISIRAQRSRWGSCSSKGNLNFNCLLMLMPDHVVDYVVVHELCHRRQMNHSKEFWNLVGAILPDYPGAQKWLKAHGAPLIARLP